MGFLATMRFCALPALVATVLLPTVHANAGTATATLDNFIQNGTVDNTSGSGVNIVEVVYSLGAAEDNVATWDNNTAGGTAEDPLSDPRYFQTVRFSGLTVPPGDSFNFGSLDIDRIVTLSPLDVSGAIGDASTLRNGFIQANFSDGTTACANLVEQAWSITQNLTLSEGVSCDAGGTSPPPVLEDAEPVPAAPPVAIALLALLLSLGAGATLRKRQSC